jgi:hypothetical protein
MAQVLVRDDGGTVVWKERVTSADFDTEHFRRCLAERLWWAVADAESRAPAALRLLPGELASAREPASARELTLA